MQKQNFFTENTDIQFQLENKVNYERVFSLLDDATKELLGVTNTDEFKSTWFEVLSTLGEISGSVIAPAARQVEEEEIKLLDDGTVQLPPKIVENINVLVENGFNAMSVGTKYGGLGSPIVFDMAAMEMVNRACPSTSLNGCWYGSISHVIEEFATDELAEEYCSKIAAEGWSGNMALTEAEAGSDLGSMKTYGVIQGDGSYKLYGAKRFISNGDSEISLVLARQSKEHNGLNGLSLYLCPRHVDGALNYQVSKIEEKVALHGSATCELNFDGSKAFLLGEEGQGFRYMLTLMNEARMGVSFQAIGLMEAVYSLAKNYASERQTWGQPIEKHALVKEMLLNMEADLMGSRSLAYKAAAEFSLMYSLSKKVKEDSLSEQEKSDYLKEIQRYKRRVRTWTPLLKYFTAEKGVEHARNGLQIHGGYGFTKEYDAERLLRESLIYPIYEGTSQIQALMCVKDTLKEAVRRPTDLIENSIGLRLKGLATTDSLRRSNYKLRKNVNSAVLTLIMKMVKVSMSHSIDKMTSGEVLKYIKTFGGMLGSFNDFSLPMQHAERICILKCYEHIANTMCQDAKADPSRRAAAERFVARAYAHSKQIICEIEALPVI